MAEGRPRERERLAIAQEASPLPRDHASEFCCRDACGLCSSLKRGQSIGGNRQQNFVVIAAGKHRFDERLVRLDSASRGFRERHARHIDFGGD